ncbi:MAG: hypothetical protein WAL22_23330 [Solirubrobacteraceae bacterium]
MPYRAGDRRADTTFVDFSYQTGSSALKHHVESRRAQSEAELVDWLRATAAQIDPLPATVRNRVRAALVLAALERGLERSGRPPQFAAARWPLKPIG